MKQIFISKNMVTVKGIPEPLCNDIGILVSTKFSLISSGTETAGMKEHKQDERIGLIKKAIQTENLLSKVKEKIKKGELLNTVFRRKPLQQTSSSFPRLQPTGYSCAGIVIEKGDEVEDINVGDRVACAGSPHTNCVYVPRNLFVRIPDNVSFEEASSVALGAIAMHGIRRSKVQMGDAVVVMGMGLLGQLVAQILKSIHCNVICTELLESRLKLAKKMGADITINPDCLDPVEATMKYTEGIGADAVIICASSRSSKLVEQAFALSRKKGTVVVIGDVGMNLSRRPHFYKKEIDFYISCSYGPGRYDEDYEKRGLGYPLEDIRWTEKRNMEGFLSLISQGKINVKGLITHKFPFEKAQDAYGLIVEKPDECLAALLDFRSGANFASQPLVKTEQSERKLLVGFIGCGSFTRNVRIPRLKSLKEFVLKGVAAKTRDSALFAQKEFGFQYASTDYRKILHDNEIDTVFIATRHNLHAKIALEALDYGKNVFVEKPLAITTEDCKKVVTKVMQTGLKLGVGFNRRCAPLSIKAKNFLSQRKWPIMVNYRVVSGFLPGDHWTYNPEEGGGRIISECCHFFDLICWLLGSKPVRLYAEGGRLSHLKGDIYDNVVLTLNFKDGSLASLIYGDLGNPKFPKERIEIFGGNLTIVIDNFKRLEAQGLQSIEVELPESDKGFKNELRGFASGIFDGENSFAMANDGLWATFLCEKAIESLNKKEPVIINPDELRCEKTVF